MGTTHTVIAAGDTVLGELAGLPRLRAIASAASAPPVERVLLYCGARTLSAEAQAQLGELATQLGDADWERLCERARVQGLAPLVFHHLARGGLLARVPPAVADDFAQEYRQTLINNRRLQTVLAAVLNAFAAERIPVVTLKGLALALRYYGDIALRPMSDIDLLVRRDDIPRVIRLLRQLGFAASDGLGRPTGFYSLMAAVVVYAKTRAPTIETHWELFGRAVYRPSLPAAQVWRRIQLVEFLGQQVGYLDPRDELRYLCVHAAAEHRLERLIWLVDIVELVRSLPPDWDWPTFTEETIASRLALPVAVALAFCHEALELAMPDNVLDRLCAACAAAEEHAAWNAVQANLLSDTWIRAGRTGLHGPLEWAIYLRGVLLPRAATLGQLYGYSSLKGLARLRTYARHWRRAAPSVLRASPLRIEP